MIILQILVGAACSFAAFIPGYLLYTLGIEPLARRSAPSLLDYVPSVIWVLGLTIATSLLLRLGFSSLSHSGLAFRFMDSGAAALRDTSIVFVLIVTAAVQASKKFNALRADILLLLRPALCGAIGVALGSLAVAFAIKVLGQSFPLVAGTWQTVWRGIVANANGWIGDSTTQLPTLAILDDGTFGLLPVVMVLDIPFGVLWFAIATKVASNNRLVENEDSATNPSKVAPHPEGDQPASKGATAVAISVGLCAVTLLRFFSTIPGFTGNMLWPLAVIAVFLFVAFTGFACGRRNHRLGHSGLRTRLMMLAIGMMGLKIGFAIYLETVAKMPLIVVLLTAAAFGSFFVHVLFLNFLSGSRDFGLLSVASMCSIGGLATAPVVARIYSDRFVEPCYFVALLCNALSIPVSLMMAWLLSQ